MSRKIRSDLSTLYNIPENVISKLDDCTASLIGDTVYQNRITNNDISEIDIGYGTLVFRVDVADIKVKFIPSDSLQKDLKNIANGGKPRIVSRVEKTLIAKLNELYKEII